ncbi:amidohydrolase family protein, partial [Acidobacteriota bacterium]
MNKVLLALLFSIVILCACTNPGADLVLRNAQVYTLEEEQPWASAVVIRGNEIVAVLEDDSEASAHIGPATQVIDLEGRFVMPGFIDAHVHFAGYAAQQHDIQLMHVENDEGLVKELRRVVENVGPGEWITGGDWSGAIQWMEGRGELDGPRAEKRWEPHRQTIDPLTQDNPCLLNSYERDLFLANSAALRAAGLENGNVSGMQLDES